MNDICISEIVNVLRISHISRPKFSTASLQRAEVGALRLRLEFRIAISMFVLLTRGYMVDVPTSWLRRDQSSSSRHTRDSICYLLEFMLEMYCSSKADSNKINLLNGQFKSRPYN